ncbi:MAG: DUF1028 domain-containing protein [Paracoccaceae bacterium]|nr:DUF1028 domain-containing protein [Paracoccaceae bacterium]
MTYSILVRDPATGHMGGAAATGSLCVGGWVLRGDARAGMSASQGAAPSTFWGEDVLALMREGTTAADAVSQMTSADAGRDARQLSALGLSGPGAAFTGMDNTPEMASITDNGLVAAGNLLQSAAVIDAVVSGFTASQGALPERLLTALDAGSGAGGDSRGLMSAAILVVGKDIPPLSLRVDYSLQPLQALEGLLERTQQDDYSAWLNTVPVCADPMRRDDG